MVNKSISFKFCFLLLPACMFLSCGGEDQEKIKYDPARPTFLDSFYPDKGKFQEKVMLVGDNLPTDPGMVRVYFNSRRAPMIGGTVNRMYVMAPRLPGNECVISVVVNNDSLTYDDIFMYEESITVTTIAGNGNMEDFQEGALANAIMQPRFLCADKDNNIIIANRSPVQLGNSDRNLFLCRLNEEENVFVRLQQGALITNIPCADPVTGVISAATESTIGSFITCAPTEYWAPRPREMKWLSTLNRPINGWKHCMVINPSDGYIYTRWNGGQIVRVHQQTLDAEVIALTDRGDSYGLTFRPKEPNILYMSFDSNAGVNANSICSIDVSATDPASTFRRLSSPSSGGGHRDGDLSVAQFKKPYQIFCDLDGFIYVADMGNHCVRRITPENQVETVLGIPGVPGWKDGTRDEALFKNPMGIAILGDGTVYVGDNGNGRLRKLSVN